MDAGERQHQVPRERRLARARVAEDDQAAVVARGHRQHRALRLGPVGLLGGAQVVQVEPVGQLPVVDVVLGVDALQQLPGELNRRRGRAHVLLDEDRLQPDPQVLLVLGGGERVEVQAAVLLAQAFEVAADHGRIEQRHTLGAVVGQPVERGRHLGGQVVRVGE